METEPTQTPLTGEQQVARLNALLATMADVLTRQDKRIMALEAVAQGQQNLLRMAGDALRGHQAVLEANGMDAVKVSRPAQRFN